MPCAVLRRCANITCTTLIRRRTACARKIQSVSRYPSHGCVALIYLNRKLQARKDFAWVDSKAAAGLTMDQEQSSVAQLDVPVGKIDEVFPEIVLGSRKCNLDKGPPLWPLGFADQSHVRLARESVALLRVTGDA